MHEITNSNSGVYVLEIFAGKPFHLMHRKYQDIVFPGGYYYYIGSAQKNLTQRLQRHKSKNKKVHWHIDHITSLEFTNVVKTFILRNKSKEHECELVFALLTNYKLQVLAAGFGNSDCNKCQSHLLYSKSKIKLSSVARFEIL